MVAVNNQFAVVRPAENSPSVDWDLKKTVSDEYARCPIDPGHPGIGRTRANDLHIILPTSKIDDFIHTWHSEYIITDRVADILQEHRLTGFELRPVHVTRIRHGDKDVTHLPRLWELLVLGWAGLAPEESGVKLQFKCPACGHSHYSPASNPAKLIDPYRWDGSDFFMVWPLPAFVFVTNRVRSLAIDLSISGVAFIEPRALQFHPAGLSPGCLWYYMGRERAKKLGGPLGIE